MKTLMLSALPKRAYQWQANLRHSGSIAFDRYWHPVAEYVIMFRIGNILSWREIPDDY